MGRRSFIHLFVCLYISFECFIIIIIIILVFLFNRFVLFVGSVQPSLALDRKAAHVRRILQTAFLPRLFDEKKSKAKKR